MGALMLEGNQLDACLARVLTLRVFNDLGVEWTVGPSPERMWRHHANGTRSLWAPSTAEEDWGALIASHQIFLDPPHDVHASNLGPDGMPTGCWHDYEHWTAVVSARVRTYPNPNFVGDDVLGHLTCVGRGEGKTVGQAICNAIVASFGYGQDPKLKSITSLLIKEPLS